jgi:hypothetical protein
MAVVRIVLWVDYVTGSADLTTMEERTDETGPFLDDYGREMVPVLEAVFRQRMTSHRVASLHDIACRTAEILSKRHGVESQVALVQAPLHGAGRVPVTARVCPPS